MSHWDVFGKEPPRPTTLREDIEAMVAYSGIEAFGIGGEWISRAKVLALLDRHDCEDATHTSMNLKLLPTPPADLTDEERDAALARIAAVTAPTDVPRLHPFGSGGDR